MTFPPRPPTDDSRRTELLKLMEVPDSPQLYVLGCFAQYVTVYAQQVRAFNLVDALVGRGRLTAHNHVAVIGGGIAGLTAAAAAAVRGVERVVVFEKQGATMRVQRDTDKRFLHPHIYDWPGPDADAAPEDDRAGHDILDWNANRAATVVTQLDVGWQHVRLHHPALEAPRLQCQDIGVLRQGGRWRIEWCDQPAESFDVVLLAVGFGRDASAGTQSYWTDTSLDDMDEEFGGTWFVSGYGDGGLTDLMRLCIMDFRHREVLEHIDAATREVVGVRLVEADNRRRAPSELAEQFLAAAAAVKQDLDPHLKKRAIGRVVLNCPSEDALFSGRSSILNRLIVAYLKVDKRFELFDGGRVELPLNHQDGRYRISFQDRPDLFVADRVIIRHGPAPAIEADFPGLRFRQLKAKWRSLRQHEDWTRVPIYTRGAFSIGDAPLRVRSRLRADFAGRLGCVVITGTHKPPGISLSDRVEHALHRYQLRLASSGAKIATAPETIAASDALATAASYEWTVRALCDSAVAVFDLTGLEGAVMLLLGIRAAVRRGVTLTVSQNASLASSLPFNLAALNPIALDGDEAREMATAMESGFASLTAQRQSYLDLPAFDAVRNLGEEHRPVPPEEEILVLRWFDPQYGKLIQGALGGEVVRAFGEQTRVITTLDSRSPQLVSQRLYAAIRRTQVCIADWTGWRPNVLFETGVRLAVNPNDPLVTLCKEKPPGWESKITAWPADKDPSREDLKAFFAPIGFAFDDYKHLAGHLEAHRPPSSPTPRGRLAFGQTYQVVLESIARDLEPGGEAVTPSLMREAKRISGVGVPEAGGSPLLYAEALEYQARCYAAELMLATWHYLDRRHARGDAGLIDQVRAGAVPASDPRVHEMREVGRELTGRLRNLRGGDYHDVRSEILRALDVIDTNDEEMLGHE